MNIIRVFVVAVWLMFANSSNAQDPNFYLGFDAEVFEETIVAKEDAIYMVDLQQSQFTEGLMGKALDLSANAAMRRPVKLQKGKIPIFNSQTSFSVQIWVKTLPGARMGTPIMGNKKADDTSAIGWQIYTQDNGAWALQLNDGKNSYSYKPTAKRQRINDGKWHQIVVTVQREKQEVWMYFDGENTAIYNTPGLGSLETELSTVVGGSDEKWEYGSNAQWNAFNGFIDEVKVWGRSLTSKEVKNLYIPFYPNTVRDNALYDPKHLKVLAWNIWHGGHRYGQEVGVERVIETIKSTNADIVGLIETYGSGEVIADALGYHFYLISSNLSIMSRYPISETIKAFKPFNFGGAKLKIGPTKEVVYFDTWLHYLPDYSSSIIKDNLGAKELIANETATRHSEIKQILKEIDPYLKNTDALPIIMGGDFNIGSHFDWTERTKAIHYDKVVSWPESREMVKAGFIDSYRELHIDPLRDPGFTWTPRAATSSDKYGLRDRIDYIYYKGKSLSALESKVIDYHPIMFPSDHAAVITVFQLK